LIKVLLVPAALLLTLGAESLYHAVLSTNSVAVDCAEFARERPRSHRLLITGCDVDTVGAAYRESDGQVREIFLPARPRGSNGPSPIVVATREPAALSVFQQAIGGPGGLPPHQSLALMEKVAAVLQLPRAVDGVVRAGFVERLRSRDILSGLSVAPDAVILDVNGGADFVRPLLALLAGLVLAAVPFSRRTPSSAEVAVVTNQVTPPLSVPATFAAKVPATAPRLPKLLLLKLEVDATPENVENAPPLGSRRDVVEILSGVIQDLEMSKGTVLARPDGSLILDLGPDDPVPAVVIDARGEAGVALVKEVLLMTGWRAFVPKTGLFVTVHELNALGALAAMDR
jgi:hypothetical protein